ncbi:MAG: ATP-binding protein [Desulfobulbaceae bacterium]|nr:ATP-binding protein [Desulfobulbaceae bacterium]
MKVAKQMPGDAPDRKQSSKRLNFFRSLIHTPSSGSNHLHARLFRKRILLTGVTMICFCIIIALFSDRAARYFAFSKQRQTSRYLVEEINTFIISHFEGAVLSLAKNVEVKAAVSGIRQPDHDNLLTVLSTAKEVLKASLVYVLDAEGTVICCSIPDGDKTVTGYNYGFRHYFSSAMKGITGTYAAVGVTSEERDLYFSRPVLSDRTGKPAGVMVIKVPMDFIDYFIDRFRENLEIMVLSQEGIILAATRSEWLYRAALPLSEQDREDIIASRKFHDQPLASMPFQVNKPIIKYDGKKYLVRLEPGGLPGWNIVTLRQSRYPLGIVLLLEFAVLILGLTLILGFISVYREEQLTEEVRIGRERRKRVEESRLTTRQELETILATSLVGITLVRDGVITNVNRKMSDILGYSITELLGKDIRIFFQSKVSFRQFIRTYARQLEKRDLEHIEYPLKKRDGQIIPCSLSGKAIDRNDLSRGIVWVIEDIRERKKVEEDLRQAQKDAETASQAKSEFLANMSHEIRTPMNGIIGIAEMLHHLEMDPKKGRQLELIITSAKRLMKIINDILDFSKNEMERFVLDNTPFSLRKALSDVIENFSVQAAEKKLFLELQIDSDVPDIMVGDETRLMQVLYNLIGNGLKFTDQGGVSVHLGMDEKADPEERRILFEVIDTGIGISLDKQDKIFEAFAQVDSSHSRRYGGTGLGLPISRRFVQLMGGDLFLESSKGTGSRFWFSLPWIEVCTKPEHKETDTPAPAVQFADIHHPARILLAEDNIINTSLAVSLLEMAGFEVQAVTNGRDAVRKFQEESFDCILMDVQMPDIDGFEAVRQIRQFESEHGGHIPIIAMTACAMEGDREKCMEAGMDDYLPKPIDRIALFSVISCHVNQLDPGNEL